VAVDTRADDEMVLMMLWDQQLSKPSGSRAGIFSSAGRQSYSWWMERLLAAKFQHWAQKHH
jgi:hypothetical protein